MNSLRKMGSASSSSNHVSELGPTSQDSHTQRGERELSSRERAKLGKDKEFRRLNEELSCSQIIIEQGKKALEVSKQEIVDLKSKLALLELQKTDMAGRISRLEEHLEVMNSQNTAVANENDRNETLSLTMVQLARVQAQLGAKEDFIAAMKQKVRKRLKTMKEEVAREKQSLSLTVFELKDEIVRLQEENAQLQAKTERLGPSAQNPVSDERVSKRSADDRTQIIIQLSSQISEQQDRILELEESLREKDTCLAELKAAAKASTITKLSPRDAKSIIQRESEKVSIEMHAITKELRMLKKTRHRDKGKGAADSLQRELSAASHDSGVIDEIECDHSTTLPYVTVLAHPLHPLIST